MFSSITSIAQYVRFGCLLLCTVALVIIFTIFNNLVPINNLIMNTPQMYWKKKHID